MGGLKIRMVDVAEMDGRVIKAIIFDCDGVLVDSERISCQISVDFLAEHGCKIDVEDFMDQFLGVPFGRQLRILDENRGKYGYTDPLVGRVDTKELKEAREARKVAAFERELQAIEDVQYVLRELKSKGVPIAVASGAGRAKLMGALGTTGLIDFFSLDSIFSADDLTEAGGGKTVLFGMAAEKLGVPLRECLVVEDAVAGAVAAKNLGTMVLGFTGGSHMNYGRAAALREVALNGVFGNMTELLRFVEYYRDGAVAGRTI